MKKFFAGIMLVLIFCGVTFADEFCDKPFGLTFFSSREYVEAYMSKDFGPISSKKDGITSWFKDDKTMGCFFRQNKLIGVSTIVVSRETPETIKIVGDTFIKMSIVVDKDPDWIFERKFEDSNGSLKMMGVKYGCKKNPMEKMEIQITRDPANKLVSLDIFSYLSGFGVREH